VPLTISVGVVSLSSGGHDVASEGMKECADTALYAAKRGGRDRVRVWNGDRINGEVGVTTSGGSLLVARATQAPRATEHRAAL
jgi:predicted signal transduction protein with EAL and GGDEF domain